MAKQSNLTDRNFDGLVNRYQRNVSHSQKGQIRRAVIERDLAPLLASGQRLNILDAGGGSGDFSLPLALAGHQVTLCDISAEMIAAANAQAIALGVHERVDIRQQSLQDIAILGEKYDLVINHAVLEWLAEPQEGLQCLASLVRPKGHLSLAAYNLDGMIFKNLLRTNFNKILADDLAPRRGSLTPISPLKLTQLQSWIEASPLEVVSWSGIRVIHDYIMDPEQRRRDPDALLAMEIEFSQRDPYRALGRYLHFVLQLQK